MPAVPQTSLAFTVYGIPKPQGSKRAFVITPKGGGKPRAVVTEDSRTGGRDWRTDATNAAREAMTYDFLRIDDPVIVTLAFAFDHPKSHHGARGLLPSAPRRHTVKPDVDKLARAMLDALTAAGVYRDDSQVVELHVTKSYTEGDERPGCAVIVTAAAAPSATADTAAGSVGEAPDPAAPSLF